MPPTPPSPSPSDDDDGRPRVRRIDGPMLPYLNHFPPSVKAGADGEGRDGIPRGSASLAPILTPPLGDNFGDGVDDDEGEQYLLVPNPRIIAVRSARHGRRVCDLLLPMDGEEGGAGAAVRAVALAWLPRARGEGSDGEEEDDDDDDDDDDDESDESGGGEWIVLAATRGGLVHEWPVAGLSSSKTSVGDDGVAPRRSFRATYGASGGVELIHLASVEEEASSKLMSSQFGGAVLYGLAREESEKKAPSRLVRCVVPPFAPPEETGKNDEPKPSPLEAKTLAIAKAMSSKSYGKKSLKGDLICLRKDDEIFGLAAAYRSSNGSSEGGVMDYAVDEDEDAVGAGGDVFVILCASRGVVVCRDDGDGASLVHFEVKSTDKFHAGDADQVGLTCAAVSPGARDLALGRADGRIEVMDNLFANASSYLNGKRDGLSRPEGTTVRRTVHWHAHPVRALSFFPAGIAPGSGGANGIGPTTLVSGGEESVLVSWQLDRSSHRPSDFVARLGHGAIVSVLVCPRANRVFVFCSDDSVQCLDGTSYDCVWKERGLACMALSWEEAEHHRRQGRQGRGQGEAGGGGGEGRGPVVAVGDPITGLPMLTNLPGAPGMVHWYDPRSASVVGTLEVAPYNRVSRRDPSEPHVPAPCVTHLAVGKDGRDMVTVDAVWTENTSVGRACRLPGHRGAAAAANVCTSIKFWSYIDPSRRRPDPRRRSRNGDVPAYDLVSSMVAPHGRDGEVLALAVSPDGRAACTLSRGEDAFRLWVKSETGSGAASGAGSTPWRCLYRVRTPSGYSNLLSWGQTAALDLVQQRKLVAFSSDGTVLSVAYGPRVTLWDHSNATLLTSVTLDSDNDRTESDMQSVDFLTKDDGALLLATAGRIGVKSPFGGAGSRYLGEDEWYCDVASHTDGSVVSAVAPLHDFVPCGVVAGGGGYFAVAVSRISESIVSVIGRDEGSGVRSEGAGSRLPRWRFSGAVQTLYVDECKGTVVRLLAITTDGRMLSLESGVEEGRAARSTGRRASARAARAPVLKLGATALEDEGKPSVKRRKISVAISGWSSGKGVISGFDFPNALSGKFTSAFIAESLGMSNC